MTRHLTAAELQFRLQISAMTLWRLERAGRFPIPVRVGRQKRWTEDQITTWESANRRQFEPA